jgi:phosphocarrier protein
MVHGEAVIQNEMGIHCRPSAVIVKEMQGYPGTMIVRMDAMEVDCRSIMGLLSLGLGKGVRVHLTVEGPDEVAMCRRLVALFEMRYDFPPKGQ